MKRTDQGLDVAWRNPFRHTPSGWLHNALAGLLACGVEFDAPSHQRAVAYCIKRAAYSCGGSYGLAFSAHRIPFSPAVCAAGTKAKQLVAGSTAGSNCVFCLGQKPCVEGSS